MKVPEVLEEVAGGRIEGILTLTAFIILAVLGLVFLAGLLVSGMFKFFIEFIVLFLAVYLLKNFGVEEKYLAYVVIAGTVLIALHMLCAKIYALSFGW